MPIHPAALADLDVDRDLGRAMQQITSTAKELLRVDLPPAQVTPSVIGQWLAAPADWPAEQGDRSLC